MIDLHTHLLPNLDDGARNFPEALKIIKREVDDGVSVVVATPNYVTGLFEPTPEEIHEQIAKLQQAVAELRWPIEILPGMEVRLTPNLFKTVPLNQLLTINRTSYLLVDLFEFTLDDVSGSLNEIIKAGLIPILAHPEKYAEVQADPNVLTPWIEKKLLLQVSTDSLVGAPNHKVRETAERLLATNLVQILATDVHNPFERYVSLEKGLAVADRFMGDQAKLLVSQNCDMIIRSNKLEW